MECLEINTSRIQQLGDTISILFGMYNYATYNKCSIKVSSPYPKERRLLSDLLELFPCPNCGVGDITKKSVNIDFLYDGFWNCYLQDRRPCEPYPNRIYQGLGRIFGGNTAQPILFPKCILTPEPEDIVLIQFDSRSVYDFKKPLRRKELRAILDKFALNEKIGLLGGPDTQRYIRGEPRFGNIKYMTQQMLNCKRFVGCDSGVSHLAGLLEKEMLVVPLGRTQRVIEYYSWYKNCTIYPRYALGPTLL